MAKLSKEFQHLAHNPTGCSEAVMLAHGFEIGILNRLVLDGFATATREAAYYNRRGVIVTRMRISPAGRRLILAETDYPRLWEVNAASHVLASAAALGGLKR
jgi:hypothetical protein